VVLRGKVTERSASFNCAPGFGAQSRRRVFRHSEVERGKPRPTAKPDCSRRFVCAEPSVGRSRRSIRPATRGDFGRVERQPKHRFDSARGHMTARTRTSSQGASPIPVPKLGNGRFPAASISAEAEISTTELPFWSVATEVAIARKGALGVRDGIRLAEAGRFSPHRSESCLPPASRRSGTQAQDTQCWDSTTLPWGSVPFGVWARAIVVPVYLTGTVHSQGFSPSQRFDPARALWLCFAPHPPLGFLVGLQSFSLAVSRDASRRPLLSCRFGRRRFFSSELELNLCPRRPLPRNVLPFLGNNPKWSLVQPRQWPRRQLLSQPPKQSGGERAVKTAERGVNAERPDRRDRFPKGRLKQPPTGQSLRLQSFAPTESPYSERAPLGTRPSRCSLDLSPLRGLPIQSLGSRPPLMCLLGRPPLRPKTLWLPVLRHFRVSIRPDLEATPKTGSNLHGVCDLFRSPKTLGQSRASSLSPSRRSSRERVSLQQAPGCHSL
jgi:hypothetical protein